MALPNKEHLVFFFCCLLTASMIYSPFLLSVSMIALIIISGLDFKIGEGRVRVWVDREALRRLHHFRKYPDFLSLSLFFFLVLISFWQTYDYEYWFARLRIKLPFLLLPLVFIALPRFSERQVNGLFYFLLSLLFLTSLGIGINYLFHYQEILLRIEQGQPIPTPRNHIRFSLLLAYGILGGIYLYRRGYVLRYNWEKPLILGLTVFLFLFIHFLAVRSGLAALYAGILAAVVRYVLASGKYLIAGMALAGLVVLPWAGYHLIPSLQTKVNYMLWDWKMFQEGKGADYADAGRLTSLLTGYELFRANPVIGVGAGNLKAEATKVYEDKYPDFPEPLVPHNQFLFVLAGTGLVGGFLFLFAFLFPLLYRRNYRQPLFLSFYAVIFTAFLIEHTIENSIGVAFFLFFVLLWLNSLREK